MISQNSHIFMDGCSNNYISTIMFIIIIVEPEAKHDMFKYKVVH